MVVLLRVVVCGVDVVAVGASVVVVFIWVGTGTVCVVVFKAEVVGTSSRDTLAAALVKLTSGCFVVDWKSVVKLLTIVVMLKLMVVVTF